MKLSSLPLVFILFLSPILIVNFVSAQEPDLKTEKGDELIKPIESLLKEPYGRALYARFRQPSGNLLTCFIIHENKADIQNLPDEASKEASIETRSALFLQSGVGVVTVMLRIEGAIYETWFNFHNLSHQKSLYDLSDQEKICISFYDKTVDPVRLLIVPNTIRGNLKKAIESLQKMKLWKMNSFDISKEELYKKYSTPEILWDAIKSMNTSTFIKPPYDTPFQIEMAKFILAENVPAGTLLWITLLLGEENKVYEPCFGVYVDPVTYDKLNRATVFQLGFGRGNAPAPFQWLVRVQDPDNSSKTIEFFSRQISMDNLAIATPHSPYKKSKS